MKSLVPMDLLKEIIGVPTSAGSSEDDSLIRSFSSSRSLSVRFAYYFLENISFQHNWGWNCIWKLDTIARVHFFCWLLVYERVLTNASRAHKGLSISTDSSLCHQGIVGLLHALKDCRFAKGVWLSLKSSRI